MNEGTVIIDGLGRGGGKKTEDFWGITWFSGVIEGGQPYKAGGPYKKLTAN